MSGLTSTLTPGGWDVDDTPSGDQVGGGGGAVSVGDSPSANRAAIQAALDAGGRVVIDAGGSGGDVVINGTVYVGDNTTFETAPGTVLKQADSTNKAVIASKATLATPATVTAAWVNTATASATLTWAGHALSEGDAVVLQGANEAEWWLVARVSAVTDANTVVLRLPRPVSAAPTGTLTARRCNRRVNVNVAIDYNRRGNNTAAGATDRMASVVAFLCDSDITVRARDVAKYSLLLAGCDNVTASGTSYPTANSDTVKVYGPAVNMRVHAEGQGPEDCVTTQALEPEQFVPYMPCQGNIYGVTIRDASARATTAGAGAMVVYGDERYITAGIVIEGGEARGMGGSMHGLVLRGGNTFDPALIKIEDVTVRNILLGASGNHCVSINCRVGRLRLDAARFSPPDSNAMRLLRVNTGGNLDELIIENLNLNVTPWPTASASYGIEISGTGTVTNTLVLRRCRVRGNANLRLILLSNATVRTVILEDCDMATLDAVMRNNDVAGVTVIVRGGRYDGVLSIANMRTSGRLILQGSPQINNASNGVVRAELAGTVVEVDADSEPILTGTSYLTVALSGAVVHPKSDKLKVDIGGTGNNTIGRAAGNRAFALTARGTIPANTPVVCDGTKWASAVDTTLTYT